MSDQRSQSQATTKAVAILFFLSGAAGLLYEVAWFRRLQLVFGISTFAIGAVISAFMLGLAGGSRWAGSVKNTKRPALRTYAILEGAVAVHAVLFPALVAAAERIYSSVFGILGGHFLTLSLLRLLLSLVVLLPGTFCMGATLPILARVISARTGSASLGVGLLYAINTLGGVAGTLFAGFFALEHLGIRGTIWFGAGMNLVIAGVAWMLSVRGEVSSSLSPGERAGVRANSSVEKLPHAARARENPSSVPRAHGPPPLPPGRPSGFGNTAMWIIFLTGLISMALEVVWTRALVFYIHNSTYAFSAILAIYLLGLAAGAAVGARFSTKPAYLKWLCGALVAICASTLLSIAIYRHLPDLMKPLLGEKLAPQFAGLADRSFWIVRTWSTALWSIVLQVAATLFAPAFLFGSIFPLTLRMAKESAAADPQPLVARLYAMNTLGSVIGTVCGSFLLIPLMGTRGAMVMLAWLSLPAALFLIFKWPGSQKIRFATIAVVTGVLAAATVLAAPPGFYKQMFARRFGNVLWFSEGISETVAICEHADKSAWIHYSDGRGASGTTSFRGGWLYAHVPLLLHPDPHSALVICFGTGNTLGAARLHPLERVDGVELSREVPKASVFFKETNHDVANNPNVRLVIEDGRNYLLGNNQTYDVITEEPPLLHTAGVVNLYSKDFYQLCARRLTENGIMAVWLATWELEDRDVRMLVRAFVEAFPYTSAWDSRHLGEWILVGSKKPLAIDPARMKQRMAEPILARDLAMIGIRSPGDLLALYMKGDDFLRSFTRDVPPVTDDRSVVDFTTPREARANYGLGDWLTGGFNVSGVGPSGLVSELRVRDFDGIYTSRERPDALIAGSDEATRASLAKELAERIPQEETLAGRKMAWNVMACASDYMELHQPDKSFQILKWGMGIVGRVASADLFAMQASLYKQTGRPEEAKDSLQRALTIDPSNAKALKLVSEMK